MRSMRLPIAAALAAGFVVAPGAVSAGEAVLSSVGSWRIIINRNPDNSFNRCIIETIQGGHMLRVASDGKSQNFSLSVPASGHRSGSDATIGLNGQQPEYFKFAADRSRAWSGIPFEMGQAMEKARSLEVSINGRNYQWQLRSTEQAMIRLTDCVNQNAP